MSFVSGKLVLFILVLCWLAVALPISQTISQSISYSSLSVVQLQTIHNLDTKKNYTTIQAAINDPRTLDGHTIFAEEGTYYENVVVNKSILLIGENRDKTFIDGSGNGTVVSLNAQNVSISNITLINAGSQAPSLGTILLNGTANSVIQNVAVLNNPSWGIILWNSTRNKVLSSEFFNNSRWGVLLINSSENMIVDNVISRNSNGIGLGGPEGSSSNLIVYNVISENIHQGVDIVGFGNHVSSNQILNNSNGIILDDADGNFIISNNISNNFRYGVYLMRGSENNTIIENTIQLNSFGVFLRTDAGDNNTFYHNNIISNTIQVLSSNSPNTWDNGSEGNYWSDYNGTDGNGDGIGDTLYAIDENNQDNYPLMSPWTPGYPAPFWIQLWFWLTIATGIAVSVKVIYHFRKKKH